MSAHSNKPWAWARRAYVVLVTLLVGAYAGSGLTVISPGEVGLVLRCGRLLGTRGTPKIHQPGLIVAFPYPIDEVLRVPLKREESLDVDLSGQDTNHEGSDVESPQYALTGDRGLVSMQLKVRYSIASPAAYRYGTCDPRSLVQRILMREMQSLIGQSSLDEVLRLRQERHVAVVDPLTARAIPQEIIGAIRGMPPGTRWTAIDFEKRLAANVPHVILQPHLAGILDTTRQVAGLAEQIQESANRELVELAIGVTISSIEIRQVRPPEELMGAFEALQTARIEQETVQDRMAGESAQVVAEAEILAQQTIAEAKGHTAMRQAEAAETVALYEADLSHARRDPQGTTERLRREALQRVREHAAQVIFVPEAPSAGVLRINVARPGGKS